MFLKTNKTINVQNDDSKLTQTSNTSLEIEGGSTTESIVKNESKLTQAKPSKSKKKKCKPSDQISKETESMNEIFNENNPESQKNTIQSKINDIDQNQLNMIMLKPPPKIVERLLTFLSEDLIKKTLEVCIYIYFFLNKLQIII